MSCSNRAVCLAKIDDRARERERTRGERALSCERWRNARREKQLTKLYTLNFDTSVAKLVTFHRSFRSLHCANVSFEIAGNSADEGCFNFFYSTLHRGECLRQVNLVDFWGSHFILWKDRHSCTAFALFFCFVWKAAEDCANSSSKLWYFLRIFCVYFAV